MRNEGRSGSTARRRRLLPKAILDSFDDEPGTGGSYDDGFFIPLDGADGCTAYHRALPPSRPPRRI